MKRKVRYFIRRTNWKSDFKLSGIGVITDENLIIKYKNRDGYCVTRVFEDCVRYLYPVFGTTNEFKGHFVEYRDVDFETQYGNYDTREMELEYLIWYKIIENTEE